MVSTVFRDPSSDPGAPIPSRTPSRTRRRPRRWSASRHRVSRRGLRSAGLPRTSRCRPPPHRVQLPVERFRDELGLRVLRQAQAVDLLGERDGPVASYPRRHDADRDERDQDDADDAADPAAASRRCVERAGVRVHAGGAAGIPPVQEPGSGGEPASPRGVWWAPKGWWHCQQNAAVSPLGAPQFGQVRSPGCGAGEPVGVVGACMRGCPSAAGSAEAPVG